MHNDSTRKRRLSDILGNGDTDDLRNQWAATEAAAEFTPLPNGKYGAHVQTVELFTAKTGTPGVKIQFKVIDGDYAGRCVWHDLWLTPAALPQTKRDLGKLGLTSFDQLEDIRIPPGCIRCVVKVALRRDDDGTEYNRVRGFDVLGVDEPEADPFAPNGETDADGADTEPDDTSFDFGVNAIAADDADSKTENAETREGGIE